jgi:TonB-dependent SusC/RagA subfamily outer membrane receptor
MLFVTSIDLDAQEAKKDTAAPVIRIRCGMIRTSNEPLIVIDGVPIQSNALKGIDPAEIESIVVLKDAVASALYGSRAINGVILITKKEKTIRKFEVLDSLNKNILSNASFKFIPIAQPADTIQLYSNSTGYVETNLLKKFTAYRVVIQKPGYKTLSALYTSKFSTYPHRFVLQKEISEEESVSPAFPNPAQRGNNVSLSIYAEKDKQLTASLHNSSGQLVATIAHRLTNGYNKVDIPIKSQLPAGIYFLQCTADGQLLKKEKIIIH